MELVGTGGDLFQGLAESKAYYAGTDNKDGIVCHFDAASK